MELAGSGAILVNPTQEVRACTCAPLLMEFLRWLQFSHLLRQNVTVAHFLLFRRLENCLYKLLVLSWMVIAIRDSPGLSYLPLLWTFLSFNTQLLHLGSEFPDTAQILCFSKDLAAAVACHRLCYEGCLF